ncbi:hypothetical protein MMC07_004023 [Pseudocyphellaria aurata]|nr:hypothetical protein [Pseudocyphellaria aurata]
MKRNGNAISNRTYNPHNTKPAIPLDVDEVDAALERFIRQKYDQQLFSGGSARSARRHDTGSTRSSDEQPPPLPPKPGKRFGFGLRSVSSAFTLSKPNPNSPPRSPEGFNGYRAPPSPIRVNKQSRVFGASVGGGGDDLDSKLATLRDMGFPDEKRNMNVLKGLGGNLERAIESLVRLGEGSTPTSGSRTPMHGRNIAVSQPLPTSRQQSGLAANAFPNANGSVAPAQISYNEPPSNQSIIQPQNQAMQTVTPANPFQPQSYNSFEPAQPHSATYHLDKAFEGMQISQPLFPNATGGYPSQHPPLQESRLQQSMTPPVPQVPHQYFQSNPYAQHPQMANTTSNPFFSAPQVSSTPASPYPNNLQQQPFNASYNPFVSPTQSAMNQPPMDQHLSQFSENYPQPQPQPQQQQTAYTSFAGSLQGLPRSNPFAMQQSAVPNQAQNIPQSFQPPNHFPPQPLQPQQTGRIDKSSILALYNYPQLAPPAQNSSTGENTVVRSPAAMKNDPLPSLPEGAIPKPAQRSVTMPVPPSSGSRNPFHSSNGALGAAAVSRPANGPAISRNVSQESADLGGFRNGRHSPDAFASLSARSVR